MKKPSFAGWAVLITALVLIALCVAAVCLEGRLVTTEEGLVVFRLAEKEVVRFDVRSTPAPTIAPLDLPAGAVDLLIDNERTALALASETEARALLTEYLSAHMSADNAEERVLSARFDCAVYLVPAAGKTPVQDYAAALAALKDDPALIPVRVVTEQRTVAVGAPETTEQSDPAIAKGSRMFTQLGRGAETLEITTRTYSAGALLVTDEPVQQVLSEARATIVRTGTYRAEKPNEEPGKAEGPMGKDAAGLKLALPIHAAVSSYFGTRNGLMHRGIDIAAKAGTEIKAPGEGLITYIGERAEYGTVVEIDHGNGFVSRLTHCEAVQVEPHQRVFAGDTVATLAALKNAAGKPHLHYELLIDGVPYNPLYYIGK